MAVRSKCGDTYIKMSTLMEQVKQNIQKLLDITTSITELV